MKTLENANDQLKKSVEKRFSGITGKAKEPASAAVSEKDKSSSLKLAKAYTSLDHAQKAGTKTELRSINDYDRKES